MQYWFYTLDFTFTTNMTHNWASFLLWPRLFILLVTLFLCSILDTTDLWGSLSCIISSYIFILFMGFSGKILKSLVIPFSIGPCLMKTLPP